MFKGGNSLPITNLGHGEVNELNRNEASMTYDQLFQLKFREGISTYELVKRYPADIQRVSEMALLEVPEETLKEIVKEEKILSRLKRLKRRFGIR